MMSCSNDITITILVTCYKEGALLRRALDSVAGQTDQNYELVVVNDASPCVQTNSICREIARSEKVKVIVREKNGGPAEARNTGIGIASGTVIVPLDGDDVLPVNCIEWVRAALESHPEADYCFGNYRLHNVDTEEDSIADCSVLTDDHGFLDPRKYALNCILYGGSPFKRSMWRRVGGYRHTLNGWEDVDFWMRAMTIGAKGIYVPHVIYEWHRSGRGVNATVPRHRVWETHLRNRQFHRKYGDWAARVDGFLDYAIEGYADPGVRRVTQTCFWLLFPCPRGCAGRLLRATVKCFIPQSIACRMLDLKGRIRKWMGR